MSSPESDSSGDQPIREIPALREDASKPVDVPTHVSRDHLEALEWFFPKVEQFNSATRKAARELQDRWRDIILGSILGLGLVGGIALLLCDTHAEIGIVLVTNPITAAAGYFSRRSEPAKGRKEV